MSATDPLLLTELRDHLISVGLVRKPSVAGDHAPLWLEPRDGVPAPGEGESVVAIGDPLVVAAFQSGGPPSQPYQSLIRRDIVTIWLRARTTPAIFEMEKALRAELNDRRAWTMGELTVIESEQWRALDPLDRGEHGFTFITAYWFETYA